MAASMVTGFAVCTVMNPFDVISTRLYNQSTTAPLYSGPIDALRKIYRAEGALGFMKGWLAHFLRIGPHTVLTLVFWEQIKGITRGYGY